MKGCFFFSVHTVLSGINILNVAFCQGGLTALHLSVGGGHYHCVRLLLEAHCNVNELTNVRKEHIVLTKL